MKVRISIWTLLLAAALQPFLAGGDRNAGKNEAAASSGDDSDPVDLQFPIIDKGKIAEDAYDHMVGLRERGNPHIRKGLLLSTIEDDPELSFVNPEKLRQEQLALVERRDPSTVVVEDLENEKEELGTSEVLPEAGEGTESPVPSNPIFWILSGILTVVSGGALVYYLINKNE